jgi:hypothetical protein
LPSVLLYLVPFPSNQRLLTGVTKLWSSVSLSTSY